MSINVVEQYDLNSIFQMNINYNFDLLKTILDAILTKGKETSQSITDLHLIIKEKDNQIANLEQNVNNLSAQFQEKLEILDKLSTLQNKSKKETEQSKEVNPPLLTEEEDKIKFDSIKGIEDNLTLMIEVNNDELTNKLIKKIKSIECTVNSFASVLTEVSKYKIPIQEHKTIFRQHNRLLDDINDKMTKLKALSDEHEKQLQDIQIKTEDMNIMDIVQKANLIGSGDSSITFGLLSNLERKINQKMKFVDERAVKQDEETIKLRNSLSNLSKSHDKANLTISNTEEYLNKHISNVNLKVSKLDNDFNSIVDKAFNDIQKTVNDKSKETLSAFDTKLVEVNKLIISSIPKPKPVEESHATNTQIMDMNKAIKELNKKILDLDKNAKSIPMTVESIWKEISSTKENLNQKASNYEHQELKESTSDLIREISHVKDKFESFIEDQSKHDEMLTIKRKIESMNNAIHALKVAELEMSAHSSNNKIQIDTTKLLEIQVFNEFKSNSSKEYENVNDNLRQFKRLIDELSTIMKSKSSFKDLKALEDEIIEKIEELRGACIKKFSDKSETSKTLKYFDQQLKHIIDVYIKKMERGDGWLLAKKPLGGHSCGSCENYLGDLKESPQFIPWNKYPVRDPNNDKLYRIGNGFSKMLKMVTLDSPSIEKRDNNFQTSREFFNNDVNDVRDHSAPKHKNLPRIVKNPKMNLSNDELLDNLSDGKEVNEPNQPKITKIVKKGKKGD